MKPIKDVTLNELEETAVAAARAIRSFLVYQGSSPEPERKARVAATAISAFARSRASESNRMAVELMAQRQSAGQLKP